jgi:mxaJ protein
MSCTKLPGMTVRMICVVALGMVLISGTAAARELRVCADPNNLPFSNAQMEGFENKIVDLVARELNASVAYTWWPQRRGFIRNTLKAGDCDLVSGIPSGIEMLRPTRPYYRSGFAFVTRADGPQVSSLDDPVLRQVKIGLPLVGEDGSSTPPGHALAKRGIVDNIRGYMIYGDYRDHNPASEIMKAVASGEIDVAIVWGPMAGYFAAREDVPLRLKLVEPRIDGPRLPMVFDISMGVRKEDRALRDEVDAALWDLKPQIDEVLDTYNVPRLDGSGREISAASAEPGGVR